MEDKCGTLRGRALGRGGIGVDGFDGVGVARGVEREVAVDVARAGCFGADDENSRSGSGAAAWGCGVPFFRRAGLTYAWADCSSIACLLIRDLGSAEALCCHRGVGVDLSGGGFGMEGDWSREELELDGGKRCSGAFDLRGGGRPPPSSMSASSVTSGAC
jgi:hypothetical protein